MMQPLEILLQRTRALPKDADGEDCNESVNHSRVFLSVVPVCLQVHSRPDISFAVHQCVLDMRFIQNVLMKKAKWNTNWQISQGRTWGQRNNRVTLPINHTDRLSCRCWSRWIMELRRPNGSSKSVKRRSGSMFILVGRLSNVIHFPDYKPKTPYLRRKRSTS